MKNYVKKKRNWFLAKNSKECKIKLVYSESMKYKIHLLAKIGFYRIKGNKIQKLLKFYHLLYVILNKVNYFFIILYENLPYFVHMTVLRPN